MRGEIISLQLFDLGGTIDLAALERSIPKTESASPPSVGKGTPSYVKFPRPLVVKGAEVEVQGPDKRTSASIQFLYYAIGAVSVRIRFPVEAASLGEIGAVAQYRLILDEQRWTFEEGARRLVERARGSWEPTLHDRYANEILHKAYTVFAFSEADLPASEFVRERERDVAGLITGEDGSRLYDREVKEAMKRWFSYYHDDVIVVDWDAAFIIDPHAEYGDLLWVLELATLQLLQFRAYDVFLDKALERTYDDLGQLFRKAPLLRRVRKTAHELTLLRIEFAELADAADNITKFLGDWFLARVYQAASEEFHIADWRASVDEKIATVNGLYQLSIAENDTRRLIVLEVLIVLLFILDLVVLVFGR